MERSAETSAALGALLAGIGRPRLLVVGDLMLDRYTWGEAGRISPEAPVLVLRAARTEDRPGGSASVARLLAALGAEVAAVGVVGDDEAGRSLRRLLAAEGVDVGAVRLDGSRPTTVKHRLLGAVEQRDPHQIVRLDAESTQPIDEATAAALVGRIARALPGVDAVLVSDYAKGVCTPSLLRALIARARELGKPVLIDPGRGVDYERYRGATAITPNRHEAAEAVGRRLDSVDDALAAGAELCRRYGVATTLVTLDRDGIARVTRDGRADHCPARPRAISDITGAGDVVLATLGLTIAAGLDEAAAVALANVAGGIEVESVGVVPVTRAAILADLAAAPDPTRPAPGKVVGASALAALAAGYRARGARVVFTNGCFDLFHPGHLRVLAEARALGDCLIVGLNSDLSVRRLKGADRPIIPQEGRAALLAALEVVDHVCVFDAETPADLIQAIRPDVLVKGGDYEPSEVVGRAVVEASGGSVVVAPLCRGWSTTGLIDRLRAGSASAATREVLGEVLGAALSAPS